MLPVIGKPEVHQRFQQAIPDTLLRPSAKANIDRVPFPVALMQVAPWAANTQHMQNAIQIPPVILCRAGPSAALRGKQLFDQFPLSVCHIASIVRIRQFCLQKGGLNVWPAPSTRGNLKIALFSLHKRIRSRVMWSRQSGQVAKVYPIDLKGYENGETPEFFGRV